MDVQLLDGTPSSFYGLQDEDIVAYAKLGSDKATEHLLSKYRTLVVGKARSYFLVGADHEDVVQEGMIGLYKAIRDFRIDRPSGFRAFADLCVTRQIITAVKSATRQKHLPLNRYVSLDRMAVGFDTEGAFLETLSDGCAVDPEKAVVGSGMKEILAARTSKDLSALESEAVNCYLKGMSYQEIADKLHCSTKSVDNALQRVKRKMNRVSVLD